MYTVKRIFLVSLASFVMAFNINTFVHAGELLPGGFTGLALLVKEVADRFFGVNIPFSVLLYIFNAVPAMISFRFIGKKFTIYSIIMIILTGILTDFMPTMFTNFLRYQHDILLSAVFGGLLNALSITLCLFAGSTSGGTDFIAIFISQKYKKDAWNYIFMGNCVVLAIAATLFDLNVALYSIIFQFTSTAIVSRLYNAYQQRTLLIITNKPNKVYEVIKNLTNHDATSFSGIGRYKMAERILVYSVISANEVGSVIVAIRKIDKNAFINVLETVHLDGRFYMKPKD
ncbi:MAG: YitT family protein [Leptospirales bacterium]|nr:YitT family protein [Leptospirales bacterium]